MEFEQQFFTLSYASRTSKELWTMKLLSHTKDLLVQLVNYRKLTHRISQSAKRIPRAEGTLRFVTWFWQRFHHKVPTVTAQQSTGKLFQLRIKYFVYAGIARYAGIGAVCQKILHAWLHIAPPGTHQIYLLVNTNRWFYCNTCYLTVALVKNLKLVHVLLLLLLSNVDAISLRFTCKKMLKTTSTLLLSRQSWFWLAYQNSYLLFIISPPLTFFASRFLVFAYLKSFNNLKTIPCWS